MADRIDRNVLHWLIVLALTLVCIAVRGKADWLAVYPEGWVLPVKEGLNVAMQWFVDVFGWFFRGFAAVLDIPISAVRATLHWLPWSVIVALCAVVAHAASGWKLAVFTVLSLLYMLVVGYWEESMNSVALVAVSVPLAILVGFGFGVWGFFSSRAERIINPTLDLLQTIPAFAYLLPILLLFGFGPVVGLIASLLYSFPPMVRNTMLGLRRVPAEIIESGMMSGATPWQLFWQVQVPSASRQILLGVNQATMASLSMVIIASIIGGTNDIGWEVLSTMRKAAFGESLLAGIVIALIAMVLDRVTAGLAAKDTAEAEAGLSFAERHPHLVAAAGAAVVLYVASLFIEILRAYPESWEVYPARYLNDAITYVIVNYREAIETIKTLSFFYIMLPTKIGLAGTVSPYTWGFELTMVHSAAYAVAVIAFAGWLWWRGRVNAALAVLFFGLIFYFGLTNMPWPALLAATTLLAYQIGGRALAAGTALGLGFLLVTGVWPQAMLSVYLCAIAVVISFLFGTAVGIWAAHSNRVSAFVRPINDTLQTMPLFVILIPIVMIFKIGEFTALIAIVAYAFVPAIRYAEHGLRNLPEHVLEAANAMGCTPGQLLWQVKLPLALPVIMLGLNQTIMYAIAMLVIAAVVGTNGLGQTVYIGLGDGDFGVGMIAGIGMAIIAMIADRMTQAWSRSRQKAFGLA